ncbi:ChbG/HpnK family deacetylase [Winogradskyella sp.]|uniref:ChbG/HpnK family deacetylase n=1 Tax=Winogradskyella sp. TaxID=1883156 RepID=UPI0026159A62|nr:ChbG/HpnK family deacetylase [Winogradskyella sp.]
MIIINSDDFGASPSINKAIFIAFSKNLISSTSTLVNFEEGLRDAIGYVKNGKIDGNSIGIHLNLTQGIPLTEKIKKNVKFCENGMFKNNRSSTPIFKMDANSKQCVVEELHAQMVHFIDSFGFLPSHIDSHHHVHTEWAIAQCVIETAKKYQIKSLRLARNTGQTHDFKKRVYQSLLNRYIKFKGSKVTDKFGGIDDFMFSGLNLKKDNEIMVHALMSADGGEIVDLDGLNLQKKLSDLFQQSTWRINNYTEFREIMSKEKNGSDAL